MNLEEVGSLKTLDNLRNHPTVKVIMCVKAPKGIMQLFDRNYISPDSQCEAIKAFMEEHKND